MWMLSGRPGEIPAPATVLAPGQASALILLLCSATMNSATMPSRTSSAKSASERLPDRHLTGSRSPEVVTSNCAPSEPGPPGCGASSLCITMCSRCAAPTSLMTTAPPKLGLWPDAASFGERRALSTSRQCSMCSRDWYNKTRASSVWQFCISDSPFMLKKEHQKRCPHGLPSPALLSNTVPIPVITNSATNSATTTVHGACVRTSVQSNTSMPLKPIQYPIWLDPCMPPPIVKASIEA